MARLIALIALVTCCGSPARQAPKAPQSTSVNAHVQTEPDACRCVGKLLICKKALRSNGQVGVTGRVHERGTGLAGATVTVSRGSEGVAVVSEGDGKYEVLVQSKAQYRIRVYYRGHIRYSGLLDTSNGNFDIAVTPPPAEPSATIIEVIPRDGRGVLVDRQCEVGDFPTNVRHK